MSGITNLLDARFLMDVAQSIVIVLLWLRKPGQDAAKRVDDLEEKVAVLNERLSHMPLRDELTRLEGSVDSIKASMEAMKDSAAVTRQTVTRIEAFLLQAGSR